MELTVLSRKEVYLDGKLLDIKPSLKRINHSPTGFAWGYMGSGPAQLALAVMMEMLKGTNFSPDFGYDMVGEGEVVPEVKKHYQNFKSEVIARIPCEKSVSLEFDFWGWYHGKTADECIRLMKELGPIEVDEGEGEAYGECSFPDRCQKADWKHCDCSCGGANHGIQTKLFK